MTKKSNTAKAAEKKSITPLTVWTLFFAAFIGGLSSSFYLPAAIHIKFDLHTTADLVKLALTIYLAGVSLGSILVSPFTDAFGMKRVFISLFIIYLATNLICGLTHDMHVFIIARFFQGFTAVAGATLSLAIIANYLTGTWYRNATYTLVALISLGPAIGPTLGGLILSLADSWRLLFILLAVGSLAGTYLLYVYLPQSAPSKENIWTTLKSDARKLFSQILFWEYCFLAGIGFGSFFLFLSLSPYVFEKFYHWDHFEFALVGIGAGLGMSGGSIFERLYLSNWKSGKILLFGLMVSFISSLIIIVLSLLSLMDGLVFLIFSSTLLFGCGLLATTSIARAMDTTRGASDAAAGLLIGVKIGIAAIISGLATIIHGQPYFVAIAFALIILVGLAISYFVHKQTEG